MLDEPTLGLDILARRAFYDALVNDYMDETRTILITTHQVEEVENLLTDVLFIDKGRIVLDCLARGHRDALRRGRGGRRPPRGGARRAAVLRAPHARQERCCTSRTPISSKLAAFGEVHTPSVADLFVAKLSGRCSMNTNMWLIRREFWENRAIWIIPAVFGVLLIARRAVRPGRAFRRLDLAERQPRCRRRRSWWRSA